MTIVESQYMRLWMNVSVVAFFCVKQSQYSQKSDHIIDNNLEYSSISCQFGRFSSLIKLTTLTAEKSLDNSSQMIIWWAHIVWHQPHLIIQSNNEDKVVIMWHIIILIPKFEYIFEFESGATKKSKTKIIYIVIHCMHDLMRAARAHTLDKIGKLELKCYSVKLLIEWQPASTITAIATATGIK